jgi:hypothetical protein
MPKSNFRPAYVVGVLVLMLTVASARAAGAADITVSSAAALQDVLNTAVGGDTIYLAPGTYVGNFKLPVHAGSGYVTVRSAGSTGLPAAGTRITPAASPHLARLVSSNSQAPLRTVAGAAFWRVELLEIGPGNGASTLVELGDGSSAQNDLSQVPHHLVLDRVYVHGDPLAGQKRAIALNSSDTSIINSYVADIKAVGADSQAIAGWNGPGPYLVQNNYLEAAGTAVLFGGDDPKIPTVVPSDITFRDNTVTRPITWRSPILGTPGGVRASFTGGGSLPGATYGYRVVARRMIGSISVKSAAAAEVTVTVAPASTVILQWNAVPDAADYLVYGRSPGAENRYWVVKGTSFTDAGVTASTSGTPGSGTLWQIKNLFELKNARRVKAAHNLFANNWAQAQSGTAILFTTRNQGGSCPWCVVEQVTFEHNIVRGIGGGFQITGFDDLQSSLQGNGFVIRHNLIADLSKSWGGKAYLATITDAPRDLTFDHNTVISPDGAGLVLADGDQIAGFVFTNNVARHNTYGIFGSGSSIGNNTLLAYFPNAVVTRNVMAGGKASLYPAGNEMPTISSFQANFVNYAGGQYELAGNTTWRACGTDGLDLGADMNALINAGGPALDAGQSPVAPLTIDGAALPPATEGQAYSTALAASGGVAPITWSITSGVLPQGLLLAISSGAIGGNAITAGDYTFTVRAQDAAGTTASRTASIHVNRMVAPIAIMTGTLDTVTAAVPFAQALSATGGLGTYEWRVSGTLPTGMALTSTGVLSGTTTAEGLYPITVTAMDLQDSSRSASQSYSLYVAPAPNHAPTVTLLTPAPNQVVAVGTSLTITAHAADVDGNLSRVDVYLGTTLLASNAGPSISIPWLAATSGSYQFVAVATDARGETASTAPVTIGTTSEIVLYAADATKLVGNYQLVSDGSAAGGVSLYNPDQGAAKRTTALAAPASYAEFTFYAEAGRSYHLWIRGRAKSDSWANDSAFLQFSNVGSARIGTTDSVTFNLEEASNAGVDGWGWEDNGWGVHVLGAALIFDRTGVQTVRIQPREDGLLIDQIVLSPQQFLTTSPGMLKNDTTILSR